MKKINVIICDECKLKLASGKCALCDIDLCNDCYYEIGLGILGNSFNSISVCGDCENKIRKLIQDKDFRDLNIDLDKENKIRDEITLKIKKLLILSNLNEEKKK